MARIVGRDAELRQLARGAELAKTGQASVFLIEGEAGIGKTRVVTELEKSLRADGWETLVIRCSELDQDRPFSALASALEDLCEASTFRYELLETALGSLKRASRSVVSRAGANVVESATPAALVFDGIAQVLENQALLLVADDAHWIDEESADIVWRLSRRRNLRLITIATFRPSTRPAIARLRLAMESFGAVTLLLHRLSAKYSRELALEFVEATRLAEISDLLDSASGNPLFITELLRSAAELRPPGAQGDSNRIPDSLRALVTRRLLSLPAESQSLLLRAALLGRSFDLEELATVEQKSVGELATLLQPAIDSQILVALGRELEFQHAIVQSIISETQPEPFRRDLHREIALRLESSGASPTRIADHLFLSEPKNSQEAFVAYHRAAMVVRKLSISTSITWFSRCLVHCDSPARQFDVELEIIRLQILQARVIEAERAAVALLARSTSAVEEAQARTLIAVVATMIGPSRAPEAIGHLDRIMKLRADSSFDRAEMLGWKASLLLFSGEVEESKETANQSICTVEKYPGRSHSEAYKALSLAHLMEGNAEFARKYSMLAIDGFDPDVSTLAGVSFPHLYVAMSLLTTAPISRAIDVLEDGVALSIRSGNDLARLHLLPMLAICRFLSGDLQKSLVALNQIFEQAESWRSGGVALPTATSLRALIALLQDDPKTARKLADDAISELFAGGSQIGSADFAVWCISQVYEETGDREIAASMLVQVWEQFAKRASMYTIASELVRLTKEDNQELAKEVIDMVAARATQSGTQFDRANAMSCDAVASGSNEQFEEAAQLWLNIGWKYPPLFLRRWQLQRRTLDGTATREEWVELARSWEVFEAPLRVQQSLKNARSVTTRGRSTALGQLSKTESAVVELVGLGLTNKQVAERLFISARTVDSHVAHAMSKMGVSTRIQLVIAHESQRQMRPPKPMQA